MRNKKSASPHHTYSEDKKVNFSKVTRDRGNAMNNL